MKLRSLLPLWLVAALALVLFVGAACELDDENNGNNNSDGFSDVVNQNGTFNMQDNGGFSPTELTVGVGSTVIFQSGPTDAHFLDFDDPAILDPEEVPANSSSSMTFNVAGDYRVGCTYHDNCYGIVHVE